MRTVGLMQNKGELITGKPLSRFRPMTLALQTRVIYVNIECDINQSEHGSSLTAV